MALSGTINGSVTQKSNIFSFYLTWSATQNVSGNYSDVKVTTYWKTTNTTYGFDTVGTRNASITINGQTKSITQRFNVCVSGGTSWKSNPYKIQEFTQRVYHNTNGSKSITISARANGHAASYGPSSSTAASADCVASGTITLNTIPRASSISKAEEITLGNACKITWTPASSSFKYKLKFTLGKWSLTTGLISPGTTSAYTYTGQTISGTQEKNGTTLYKQIPDEPKGSMSVILITYNSSEQEIGRSSAATFNVKIPSDIKPSINDALTLTLGSITIGGVVYNDILVQGKNSVTVTISGCSAGTGSTISHYAFEGQALAEATFSSKASCSATETVVKNAGTVKYKASVYDERSRSAYKTKTVKCWEYKKPSFTTIKFSRDGNMLTCIYDIKYSSVNSRNQPTLYIYRSDNNSMLGSVSLASSGAKGTYSVSLNGSADTTYTVYAKISDSLGSTATSKAVKVFGTSKIFNINPSGQGFALGKMSEKNCFECRWDAEFSNNVSGPNGFSKVSDKRVKSDIKDVDINIIDKLRPIQYQLPKLNDGRVHYGFVAQEIVEVLTDAEVNPEQTGIIGHTTQDGQDIYTLTYTEFIPLVVKKCQELQKENNEMRAEIAEIKTMLLAHNSE